MTDFGTTGIQVTPKAPTEDEMNTVQDILKRAINSLVGMSQLQADVDMLRSTVQSLQADTERLRQQNAGLDEALFQSRNARNDLTTKLAQAEHDRDQAKADAANWQRIADQDAHAVADLKEELSKAKQERNDYGLQVMDLEDQLKAAEAKLAAIRDGYASIFGATPEVPKVPETSQAAPVAEPSPTPPEPETRSDWPEGYIWDYERRAYVKPKPDELDSADIPF